MGDGFFDEIVGAIDIGKSLLKINNVDGITIGEDITLHLRVPPARLMAKVDASFKQLTHRDDCHNRPFLAQGYPAPSVLADSGLHTSPSTRAAASMRTEATVRPKAIRMREVSQPKPAALQF